MFRKAWNIICDAFGFSERIQQKRSLPDDSNAAEDDTVSPVKRRRLETSASMSSYSQNYSSESRRLAPEVLREVRKHKADLAYMLSSDFINNKENATGDFCQPSEAKGSRDHPIVIDAAEESVRMIRGRTTQWVAYTPKPSEDRKRRARFVMEEANEVQVVYQSPPKSRGAAPKFPLPNRPIQGRMHRVFTATNKPVKSASNVPSDEDVQILDVKVQPCLPAGVTSGLRFASNPYTLPGSWSRPGQSLFKPSTVSSSNTSRRNSTSLGSSALDYCENRREKMRFRQLINSVTDRWTLSGNQSRNKAAAEACRKLRDIPIVTIDHEVDTREVVEVDRAKECAPTTLATVIGSGQRKTSFPRPDNSAAFSHYFHDVNAVKKKYDLREAELREQMKDPALRAKVYSEQNSKSHETIEERLREYCKVTDVTLKEVVDVSEPELPELTQEMEARISAALVPNPRNQLLVEAFSLRITRLDMHTLAGLNWLNDEVINLYMNLLIERGKLPGFPKVYAFNTFFYPRLLSGGHAALKRWTRKIDLFSYDIIIVPVHLGVHWCMAAVDFKVKKIIYFDSMGSPNTRCVKELFGYLEAESKDKLNRTFDTTGWSMECKENIPQQNNGSDCGMFACMYAEYICRGANISFTQDDMPYFRRKMCYELLTAKLLPFK